MSGGQPAGDHEEHETASLPFGTPSTVDVVGQLRDLELLLELLLVRGARRVQRLVGLALLEREQLGLAVALGLRLGGLQQLVQRVLRRDAAALDDRAGDALGQALLEVDEVELAGRADEVEDALRVVLAGDRDGDAVAGLLADLGLRDAERVDAVAEDAHRLVEDRRRDLLALLRRGLEHDLRAALEVEPEHGLTEQEERQRAHEQGRDQRDDGEISAARHVVSRSAGPSPYVSRPARPRRHQRRRRRALRAYPGRSRSRGG